MNKHQSPLKIGTRGSTLALFQANQVKAALAVPAEINIIRTSGDRFQDAALHQQGGQGFFTREIEDALTEGRIDMAVHSLKDLPVELAPGLCLGAILSRESTSDILLVRPEAVDQSRPLALAAGVRVGTSAMRRRALLRCFRPDLRAVPMRGNVPTRIKKAILGHCDALILARAGLNRLRTNPAPLVLFELNPERWICAPGQGAVAVEARAHDSPVLEVLAPLDHAHTRACVTLERELLRTSGGGCHSAFAAMAVLSQDSSMVKAAMPTSNGSFAIRSFSAANVDELAKTARQWILQGAPEPWEPITQEGTWLVRPLHA